MAARVAYSLGIFLVFGALAVGIGWSASRDWREGRRQRDGVTMLSAAQQCWPALLAGAIAIIGPVVVLVRA